MVATVRKDKKEVPREFRIARSNPIKFGFHCPIYSGFLCTKSQQSGNSHVYDAAIDSDTGDQRKPEIITYYNRTKNGVDLVDKMCSLYDVSRNSRRWPLTKFKNLVKISALNALCIYTANSNYESVKRRDFLIDLALSWMKPLAHQRLTLTTLPRTLTFKIKDFLDLPQVVTHQGPTHNNYVGRCYDCGRARNKSTRKVCNACNKFICPDHSKTVCSSCFENN